MKQKYYLIGFCFIIIALGVTCTAAIILSNGDVKVFGKYPDDVAGSSLICESSSAIYPFFVLDESSTKHTTISLSFYDDALNAITLEHRLYYDNYNKIISSEAHNHAAMNISFGENGFGVDALNARYDKLSDSLRFTIYGGMSDLIGASRNYFLLSNYSISTNTTMNDFKNFYESQSFVCDINQ